MIHKDQNGYPTDETGDSGDSAFRYAILMLFSKISTPLPSQYEPNHDGWLVRHPNDVPWNNRFNMSRDQVIPFVAAAYYDRDFDLCRRTFYAHAKRLFFSANFQRDYPGTWKFPWPHQFINDHGQTETRRFDFADPLFPDHILHLILCARLWYLYWFAILGIPWFILSAYFHAQASKKSAQNQVQIICQCVILGEWAEKLFIRWVPSYKEQLKEYWGSRNEIEYATMIIEYLAKHEKR